MDRTRPRGLAAVSPPEVKFRSAAAHAGSSDLARLRGIPLLLSIIAALSVANFNDALVPAVAGNLQQVVVLALWGAVIGATSMMRPVPKVAFGTDFYAVVAFYGFAALSVAWSDHSPATVLKGTALAITTFAAYRVATRLPLGVFVEAVSTGFILVCAASLALVLAWPAVGVDQTWMHGGQWQGVFESKQSLGTVGAFLMFFACHRLLTRGGWLRFAVVFGLAAACVIGSGSRGGAAVALAACLSLSLPGRWRGATAALAFGPLLMTVVALVAITYLTATGRASLPLFGIDVDFTERGLIWQYTLGHFADHPLLGFGLNGFWSLDAMYHGFEREHGWVLDNYHDGYVGILMETGTVGMALFAGVALLFGLRMRWLITRRRMPGPDAALIIGFINLIFFIDLTETFFLRSTNINSIVMITLLFASCLGAARSETSP